MNTHTLPQSIFPFVSSPEAAAAEAVADNRLVLQRQATIAAQQPGPVVACNRFSCMSSGRATAIDVEAARKYYVGSVWLSPL